MARLLSNIMLRGLMRSSYSCQPMVASASRFEKSMQNSNRPSGDYNATEEVNLSSSYPSAISVDPDTHEDFQPASKVSGVSLHDIIHQDVKENPVLIYMKGLPDAPRCGFSALAVKVLQLYMVPISARDVQGDHKLKEGVKAYSTWPTFPQIFIKGEFIGGSDIVLNMHQKGELKDLLADLVPETSQDDA